MNKLTLKAQQDIDNQQERRRPLLRRSVDQHAELLQALGSVSMRHGQPLQGLTFLYLANQLIPHNTHIATSLAHAYLVNGEPDLALTTLDRAESLGDNTQIQTTWTISYLKAKALLAAGRTGEAQALFASDVIPSLAAGS